QPPRPPDPPPGARRRHRARDAPVPLRRLRPGPLVARSPRRQAHLGRIREARQLLAHRKLEDRPLRRPPALQRLTPAPRPRGRRPPPSGSPPAPARRGVRPRHPAPAARSSGASPPRACISRTMSHPPMNFPPTYTWGIVGQLEKRLIASRFSGSASTSTALKGTPTSLSTCTVAAEKPHIGKLGVPFM